MPDVQEKIRHALFAKFKKRTSLTAERHKTNFMAQNETICPRCGKERGLEQAQMYGSNGCNACRTDFDRRCDSYRGMMSRSAEKTWEERRDEINSFRAGY